MSSVYSIHIHTYVYIYIYIYASAPAICAVVSYFARTSSPCAGPSAGT